MDAKTSKSSTDKKSKKRKKSAKAERSDSAVAKKERKPRADEDAERAAKPIKRVEDEAIDDRDDHPSSHAHGEAHAHIMPVKTLLSVWGGLMVLTVLTVAIAQVHLGQLNVVVALAVAVVKATLVGLYFMHLKYDTRANRVVLVSAAFFLILFVSFVVFDTSQYQQDLIDKAADTAAEAAK